MADCEGKQCYERVYETKNPKVISVNGLPAAGLAKETKTAAEAAITAKAGKTKVVKCDDGCECVRNGLPDTPWGEWKTRPVKATVNVAGAPQPVEGTIERRSKKTKQGDCEDPNELAMFAPGEWDGGAVAIARGPGPSKGRKSKG